MKTCTKCKIEKDFSEFRWRTSKRQNPYWNSSCKKCESEFQKTSNWESKKPENRKKQRKKYKEQIYKYNHEYFQKNKDELTVYKREEMREKRSNLHDIYIVKLLSQSTKLPYSEIRKYPEFIKAYKINLEFKRTIENEQNQEC